MTLSLVEKFQEIAARALGPSLPDRDALARELEELMSHAPTEYIDVHAAVGAPEHPACSACAGAAQEAAERRLRYMQFGARVDAIKAQLFRLSCGGPDELDATGHALTRLRAQVRQARTEHEARRWGQREDEPHPQERGKVVTSWISPTVLGQISLDIADLARKVSDELTYCSTEEARVGIEQARRHLSAIMNRPIRVPITPERAEAGRVPRKDWLDASGGLVPAVGRNANILGGTVRFRKRIDIPPPPEPNSESLAPQTEDAP